MSVPIFPLEDWTGTANLYSGLIATWINVKFWSAIPNSQEITRTYLSTWICALRGVPNNFDLLHNNTLNPPVNATKPVELSTGVNNTIKWTDALREVLKRLMVDETIPLFFCVGLLFWFVGFLGGVLYSD